MSVRPFHPVKMEVSVPTHMEVTHVGVLQVGVARTVKLVRIKE